MCTRKEFDEILLRDLKFCWTIRSENNFVGTLKIMSGAAKTFDILATDLSVLHNYFDLVELVQQNYFSDLYSAKILDLSAKPFFP